MSRRNSQVFNLSLLDLLTSALGAVIFLFIITPKGGAPAAQSQQVSLYLDTVQNQVFGDIPDSLKAKMVGDTLLTVLVDYRHFPEEQKAEPVVVYQERTVKTPDRSAKIPKPKEAPEQEPEKTPEEERPAPKPAPPVPTYRGDAPSVPCRVSFEISWKDAADNVDLFICKGGSCVYGGHKRDRSIGEWDSGKSRNRLFGNDLRTNQEAVRQFDRIIPGEYTIYAQFKNSRRDSKSVAVQGLIYTKDDKRQERGTPFSKTLNLTEDRVLIGKVTLEENGNFTFTKK